VSVAAAADLPRTRAAAAERDARLPLLVLALVAAVYLPSLGGDWVWDDVYQLRDNPAITQPWVLLTHDVWGPTGFADARNTPVYRPLAMASHSLGQMLWRGPLVERLASLALHLGIVVLIAALAMTLGADRTAAWFGAACFGLHPASTEAVAWISARADLLGVACVVAGALALARGRDVLAGVLVGMAPFCKEAFLLAPLSLAVWMLALRRPAPRALIAAVLGALGYLVVRHLLEIPLPAGSPIGGPADALGAVGAVGVRGATLLLDPSAPDALPGYAGNAAAGIALVALALVALPFLPGRPALAALLAPLPLLAPTAPAALANGLVADRYMYAALAGVGLAAAFGYAALQYRWRYAPLLFVLPLVWTPFTALRASDWTGNQSLFRATLKKAPDHPEALFHVAYDLHNAQGGCEAALPLYAKAMPHSRRAANNLQACLFELQRWEEAAQLGPALAARDPDNPNPALNTARALSHLGDQQAAEQWARTGIERRPSRTSGHVLLGNVLGLQHRYEEALRSFERALEIDPGLESARRGRGLALERLAEARTATP